MAATHHPILTALAKHPTAPPQPASITTLKILDYSGFEGTDIPPGPAAAAGVTAIFTRLTMGDTGTDPAGRRRLAALHAQTDVIPGVYHYAHETNPAGQVAHLAAAAGDLTGVLVQYDWELEPSTNRPISVASATAWVKAFRARYPGHPLIGYLPRWVASQLSYPTLTGLFDALWASDYSAPYDWSPYCGYTPALLQYTDHDLAGADASWYRGTLASLTDLTGGDDDMLTDEEHEWLRQVWAVLGDAYTASKGQTVGSLVWQIKTSQDTLAKTLSGLTSQAVDVTALADQLRAHLAPDLIAALATQLNKE